jgi:hypothetical protein
MAIAEVDASTLVNAGGRNDDIILGDKKHLKI